MFYAQHTGALEVVALDAADGKTAWTAPATPSEVTAGVPAELAVRDGVVFYLEGPASESDGLASIVARDASTGEVMWTSTAGVFRSWPEVCPDQLSAVCVTGQLRSGSGELRFSATTGKLIARIPIGTPAAPSRELGEDLFDPGTRHPEQLLAVSHGRVAWRLPLSRIFTLPHASTDGDWSFDRYAKLGLFVASVGVEPIKWSHYSQPCQNMTAGFSLATGRVAWRSPGAYVCGLLPCAGESNPGYSSPSASSSPAIGVRLIETGTVSGSVGGSPTYSANETVTIQGFNPATGKTTWSLDAEHDMGAVGSGALPQTAKNSIVVKTGSSETALNLSTGATRRLRSNARAWCERTIMYKLNHTQYYGGKTGTYAGQSDLYPCTVSGVASAIPASVPSFIREQGATADGLTAWTETSGIYARPN